MAPNKTLEATAASLASVRVLFNFIIPFVSRRCRQAAVPQLDRSERVLFGLPLVDLPCAEGALQIALIPSPS